MECDKVKGFLSEYIDGVLDAQVKKLIDEHLPACKSCSEELASLNACIKELGVLKGVEAPGNFLEKVHERIERKAGFSKIIQTLFIPVRIKVPLEIAAVAAMVILTINLMQSEREPEYMPAKPEGEEMARIAAGVPFVSEPEREVAEQPVPPMDMVAEPPMALAPQPPSAEEKPIELALLIKQEAPSETYALRGYKSSRASRLEVRDMEAVSAKRGEKELSRRYGLSYAPGKETEKAKVEDKKVTVSPYLSEAISKVKNIIELVDGKVISVEETATPLYITAEIPAKNYGAFLEKLSPLGDLQKPLPSVTAKDEELVQLQINFMSYK